MARYRGDAEPPDDGTRARTSSRWPTACGPSSATRSPRSRHASGAIAMSWRSSSTISGRIGVHFDTWFSERTLHERGDVARVLADAGASAGATFEDDGAAVAASHRLRRPARPRAREVRRRDHLPLQRPRVPRGQVRPRAGTHLIDIWGADHHGQVKSLQSGLEALGHPAGEPEVLLGQLVKLAAATARWSGSRSAPATSITLADILDEVDPDVCRLTFLLQGIDTTQTFDLDVVTAQSMENPVYYVQYAHAAHRVDRSAGRAARGSRGCPIARREPRAARARARARPARARSRCSPKW